MAIRAPSELIIWRWFDKIMTMVTFSEWRGKRELQYHPYDYDDMIMMMMVMIMMMRMMIMIMHERYFFDGFKLYVHDMKLKYKF